MEISKSKIKSGTKSLLSLGIVLFCLSNPFWAFGAEDMYSILFHRATSETDAEAYISKMDKQTAFQSFIEQESPMEYWVLYGKMNKADADKAYEIFKNRNLRWVEIVRRDKISPPKRVEPKYRGTAKFEQSIEQRTQEMKKQEVKKQSEISRGIAATNEMEIA